MNDYGYKKVAAAVIDVAIGDPRANLESILAVSWQTDADIIVFPELSITGYTCGELFRQSLLLRETERALVSLAEATDKLRGKLIAVGAPLRCGGRLYNCAVFAANGAILGAVPKTHIPNYSEFYEARWFSSGNDCREDSIRIGERDYPFGTDLIFREENGTLAVGAEICEDLWVPSPPSGNLAQLGANVVVNLSASNEVLSKSEYRRDLVRMQSARCVAGYVYASAGIGESTSDLVFSGHSLICDNGAIVAETRYENRTITGVIDIERLENERQRMNTFTHGAPEARGRVVTYVGSGANRLPESVNAYPFIPADRDERQRRCREILALQSNGLATRLKKTGIKTVVLGISGGVDSTLAIIVAVEAFHLLGLDTKGIIAVTMPGFGTTGRTYGNALELIEKLGAQCRTVPIADACMQHFSDIGHDPSIHDVTYENTQARERTQILMDIANKENGLVIGTGDLSELALGWCTYNGDHMSMYGVNCGVPKTLAKYVISAYGQMHPEYAAVLEEILDTPISPELLPADDNGEIAQKTEEKLGKYDLHDFILFHVLRNGFAPEKIFALGKIAFPDVPVQELQRAMETFYRRFFTQQFKRNCLPDGVKVGSVCLSPRGDWRMPSEASGRLWLDDLTENL